MPAEYGGPKPITTRYRGFRFRSRLEARWAVFLDALGLEWEYEPEGYVLSDGVCYLPDFWLPAQDMFLEIKGATVEAGDVGWRKAQLLAESTECTVVLFAGQISNEPGNLVGLRFSPYRVGGDKHDDWQPPVGVWWFMCPICGKWDVASSRPDLPCGCIQISPGQQPLLVAACSKARGARFEFGEQG